MTTQEQYAELARQLGGVGAVNRWIARSLPDDCPPACVGLLSVLQRHGEARLGQLSDLLAIDLSVTSRHVTHAVERGWVARVPDPHDRRSRLLRLTPAGAALLAELGRRYTDALSAGLAEWPEEDVVRLVELLTRLRDSLQGCRPRPGCGPAPRSAGASADRSD